MGNANTAEARTAERRRHPRAPLNRPARLSIGDGPPAPTQLMNISPFGAALFYSRPLEVGTPVWLTFSLHANPKTVTLILPGHVRESQLRGESHFIRIAFKHPPQDAVKTITEFARIKLVAAR